MMNKLLVFFIITTIIGISLATTAWKMEQDNLIKQPRMKTMDEIEQQLNKIQQKKWGVAGTDIDPLFLPIGNSGGTVVAQVSGRNIQIVFQDYIDSYISWQFTPLNESEWLASFSLDPTLASNITACSALGGAARTSCFNSLCTSFFGTQLNCTQRRAQLAIDLTNMTGYPLRNLSGRVAFRNFNYANGAGNFTLSLLEPFRDGIEMKFGFNSTVVNTSNSGSPLQYPLQHKSFYSASRHWIVFYNSTGFAYTSSIDGFTFDPISLFRSGSANGGRNLALYFNETHIAYAYDIDSSIVYRLGQPLENGSIEWLDSEKTAITISETTGNGAFEIPNIGMDSSNNPYIIVVQNDFGIDEYIIVSKSSTINGTWTTASSFPIILSTLPTPSDTSDTLVSIIPLTNNKMAALWNIINLNLTLNIWNGTDWSGEKNATWKMGNSGFSAVSVKDDIFVAVSNVSVTLDISFGNYSNASGTWTAGGVLNGTVTSSKTSPSITYDSLFDKFYVFWMHPFNWQYIIIERNGSFGTAVSIINETGASAGSRESQVDSYSRKWNGSSTYTIGAFHYNETTSPFKIKFDYLNITPSAGPAVITPYALNGTFNATTGAANDIFRLNVTINNTNGTVDTVNATFRKPDTSQTNVTLKRNNLTNTTGDLESSTIQKKANPATVGIRHYNFSDVSNNSARFIGDAAASAPITWAQGWVTGSAVAAGCTTNMTTSDNTRCRAISTATNADPLLRMEFNNITETTSSINYAYFQIEYQSTSNGEACQATIGNWTNTQWFNTGGTVTTEVNQTMNFTGANITKVINATGDASIMVYGNNHDAGESCDVDFVRIEIGYNITNPDNEVNSTATDYNNIMADNVTAIKLINISINISANSSVASVSKANRIPNVCVLAYNGTQFIETGCFLFNTSNTLGVFNMSINRTDVLTAWASNTTNRDIRIVVVNLDSNSKQDEINWTDVNVTITKQDDTQWTYVWNDTSATGLYNIIKIFVNSSIGVINITYQWQSTVNFTVAAQAANSCTPNNNVQWDLLCSDNCSIVGLNVNLTNWYINSTQNATINISHSNITYQNLTQDNVIGYCTINIDKETIIRQI